MNTNHSPASSNFSPLLFPEKTNSKSKLTSPGPVTVSISLIRFEEKRERLIWAHPDEIIFVTSADHYVKALIKCGTQNKWMSRHCTIKELLSILPAQNFIRLNKFYLLNRNHFAGINEKEKMIRFIDDFFILIPHRISRFIIDMLKK